MRSVLLLGAGLMLVPAFGLAFDSGHLDRLKSSGSCFSCDLTGFDLAGGDLSNADLASSNLSKAKLDDAKLDPGALDVAAKVCNTTLPDGTVDNSGC